MAMLVARHAERVDYAVRNSEGRSWQQTAERPWDTPITEAGIKQANALGRAIQDHCKNLGLPPVTRVFCSPLLRCVQTAAGVCDIMDPPSSSTPKLRICVEPLLRETAGEDWYRSWAVEEADGTWGGPRNCRAGVEPTLLRSEANIRSSGATYDWLCADTSTLQQRLATAEAGTPRSAISRLDTDYRPLSFRLPMTCEDGEGHSWGHFETERMQIARLGRCFDKLASLYPEETVLLVSHGGPSASLFRHSQEFNPPPNGWKTCKYCGLYAMRRQQRRGTDEPKQQWEALLEAEDSHLAAVPEAGQTSGSSAAEQMISEVQVEAQNAAALAAGQCSVASVALVGLLLLAGP